MATSQNYDNHTRYFPPFHFFAFPIVAIHALLQTWALVRAPVLGQLWAALVAWALALGLLSARVMALRVQDRVIRLEESLRMQRLLPPDVCTAAEGLTPQQLVELRFASDAELPGLVQRALAGEFTKRNEIKRAVRGWRADYLRA
ncbi:MAG: DUF6526 family protein [Gemmatimonadaceae bacterium]